MIADNNSSDRLDTDKLTWAALLGRWMAFAKNAVALPDDDAGRRVRNSVVDLITLQAVWFALQNLDELDPDERALGIDRLAGKKDLLGKGRANNLDQFLSQPKRNH